MVSLIYLALFIRWKSNFQYVLSSVLKKFANMAHHNLEGDDGELFIWYF